MAGHSRENGPRRHTSGVWGALVAIAVALSVAGVNVGLLGRSGTILGVLAVVPFLAATTSGAFGTLVAASVATGVLVAVADYDRLLWGIDVQTLLGAMAVATVLATGTAVIRRRRVRQLRDTRTMADLLQATLLESPPDLVDDVQIAVHYASALRGAAIGGDVYAIEDTAYGVRALLGDVRGKGLPAVRLASTVLGSFREAAHADPSLVEVAGRLDAGVARRAGVEDFVTALLVQVGPDGLEVVNCGHPAPLLIANGQVATVTPPVESLPLGLGVTPQTARLPFHVGDRLLLCTDGVTDARRRHRFFDLPAEVSRLDETDPAEFVRKLAARHARFTRHRRDDDVAILLLQRDGAQAPAFPWFPARREPADEPDVSATARSR